MMAHEVEYLADFDSATGMLRALAASLRGEGLPLLGAMQPSRAPLMKLVASAVTRLPKSLQEQVYIVSGWMEAVSPRKLAAVSGDEVATFMAGLYPSRQYPAVVVGSSNGAAVHLWAALGIPWLPQTFLVPGGRSGIPGDEPRGRVWVRARAAGGRGGRRAAPRVPGPARRVRAAGGHEPARGRPVSLVARAPRRRGQSPRGRLLHPDGALLDDSHSVRAILDGLQYRGLVARAGGISRPSPPL